MSDVQRNVWVSFWYQDQKQEIKHNMAEKPLIIGRHLLQHLFEKNGTTFRNISRRHIEIAYDGQRDQIWGRDRSLLGTLVRVIGDHPHDLGPEFLYHHEQFLIKRHMRLRLQNEDDDREPNDVLIEIENESHDETRPILDAPAHWDRLLSQLRSVRAAHLVGIASSGKSTLARKLLATSETSWQRQRDRQLGGKTLIAWVDCRLIHDRDETDLGTATWKQLCRRMLMALQTAVDEQLMVEIGAEVDSALEILDSESIGRIGQTTSIFRNVLRSLVRKANLRPIFVFDHFDQTFTQVDRFMLYQLYQFHQWPEIGEALRYLIITRRPLDHLRSDIVDDGVNEFVNLFARHSIPLGCVNVEDFKKLWREIAPEYNFIDADVRAQLHDLSGGHPGLTRELYEELAVNSWLDTNPEQWFIKLKGVNWRTRPPQTCIALWQSLNEAERHTVLASLSDAPSDKQVEAALREWTLFNEQGELFSPLFKTTVRVQSSVGRIKPKPSNDSALHVDVNRQRVFVSGEDVTSRLQGRKLDVLLYLYTHANQLCTYNELIQHTIPAGILIDDLYLEMERGALQRTVSRLCRIVDPRRQWINNEQGKGYMLRI